MTAHHPTPINTTHHTCPICTANALADGMTICRQCMHAYARQLTLLRQHLTVLQLVIRREVHLRERGGGRGSFAPLGIDVSAADLETEAERLIDGICTVAGLPGGRWQRALPRLGANLHTLAGLPDAADHLEGLIRINGRLERVTDRRPRLRRLVGVCDVCGAMVHAVQGEEWAVCGRCDSLLHLPSVRRAARTRLDALHTTQTPSGAAVWVSRETGIDVTRDDVNNWIRSGRITAPRLENGYREFPILRLIELAESKMDSKRE
ncbi:hypothetical protein [Bifidobacterium vansinderenii]|uniref:PhnA protein n=1 Tax=Bifidobacterium vansinderenii TaxID=1984871 RepID=A0A229W0R5_9BIFI|nr:hypothetical protein [Bifidobacterium vansinderenii]OXN01467.1 hypothetical protein Tam10B_0470 [Bifidobacterium vansinderenii]